MDEQPKRVAVVGAGLLGLRHARVWHELDGAVLAGVADTDPARGRALAEQYDVPYSPSADRLLDTSEVDAVSIATPDHLHVDIALAVLSAGKHVFVEKPLATSHEGARAIVETAASDDLLVQVNFSQRWLAEYVFIKDVIAGGDLGTPQFAVSRKRDTITVPMHMLTWASSSSPILFMTSHDLDLIRWFLDAEPMAVVAQESTGVLREQGVDVHDSVHALVTFDSDATVVFSSSWIHPKSYPILAEDRLEVVGTEGVLEYDSRTRNLEIHTPKGTRSISFSGPATATEVDGLLQGAFVDSASHFIACLRGECAPVTPASDSLFATACQDAILLSAREGGRRINVSGQGRCTEPSGRRTCA